LVNAAEGQPIVASLEFLPKPVDQPRFESNQPPEPEPQITSTGLAPILSLGQATQVLLDLPTPSESPGQDRGAASQSASRAQVAVGKGGSRRESGGASSGGSGLAGFLPPKYLHSPAPPYPDEARRAKREGVVLLSVRVGSDGFPIAVFLRRSSGIKVLDEAAIRAVRCWTFQPATLNGRPFTASVEAPIRFHLTS
jgi:protein TonB